MTVLVVHLTEDEKTQIAALQQRIRSFKLKIKHKKAELTNLVASKDDTQNKFNLVLHEAALRNDKYRKRHEDTPYPVKDSLWSDYLEQIFHAVLSDDGSLVVIVPGTARKLV